MGHTPYTNRSSRRDKEAGKDDACPLLRASAKRHRRPSLCALTNRASAKRYRAHRRASPLGRFAVALPAPKKGNARGGVALTAGQFGHCRFADAPDEWQLCRARGG
ncbi:hypothetical protein OH76DRAFT_165922 [Lentinus brumalis]|uniref:Uncharacterized protein n=1 Tax=Lentinus brumalis TaxID=2498619 RepID=A0A371DJ24_9APHY|nr:hypothetical protein OH76DRAFT_165922 [Polyporus brumalis]